jgi:hypothetical protein
LFRARRVGERLTLRHSSEGGGPQPHVDTRYVGRPLLKGLALLLIIGAGLSTGRALYARGHSEVGRASRTNPQSMGACLAESESTLRAATGQANISAAKASYLGPARLAAAMRPFCKAWLAHPETASLTQETGPPFMSRLFRENPSAYLAICQPGIDADLSTRATLVQYLSKQERARLRRDTCPVQLRYMRPDAPVIDYSTLIADHTDLYVLGCRATLQSQLAKAQAARTRFTRAERRRIAQRSCREALRTGLVNATNASGLLDVNVDQQSLYNLVLRYARQQAAR